MAKKLYIETCGDCPGFVDNYFAEAYCNRLDQFLYWENGCVWMKGDGIHPDCPLEDEEDSPMSLEEYRVLARFFELKGGRMVGE